MTTANDPIRSIQSRIDELEQTITDRGEEIKARAKQLRDDLEDELSPREIIRKHPVESAGLSLVTGFVAGRIIRSIVTPQRRRVVETGPRIEPQPQPVSTAMPKEKQSSPLRGALNAIGIELLHTAKDLAIAWLKTRQEEKKVHNQQ